MLFVGNITHRKGVDTLLKALGVIIGSYNLEFKFLGSLMDYSRPWFWRLIDRHGLRDSISLEGQVDRGQLVQYYQGADILVCPSRVEGSPRVVKEAAACGCSVIATRIPGTTIIDPDEAFLNYVDVDDVVGLANKISELIDNPRLRLEKARLGRELIEDKFSPPAIAEKMTGFYQSLFIQV